MSLNHKEMKARKLAVFAIILDILTFTLGFGFIFIAIGHDANSGTECAKVNNFCPSSTVPLGQWTSFPLASQCSSGNYSATNCEMIGNTTYRGILVFQLANTEAGVRVQFSAGCTNPSNTLGAFLQLQYANYSTTIRTNSSLFVNIGGTIKIDNSLNWPCPGVLFGSISNLLPGLSAVMFRVVGSGGGGVGDNPRFSAVTVIFSQLIANPPTFQAVSRTASGFSARLFLVYPVVSATTENFNWIATNATNTSPICGVGDVCEQNGVGSCSIAATALGCISAVTFTTAFTNVPVVIGSPNNAAGTVTVPTGSINLLSAQTLTV